MGRAATAEAEGVRREAIASGMRRAVELRRQRDVRIAQFIGEEIYRERRILGLHMREVAPRAQMSPNRWCAFERGRHCTAKSAEPQVPSLEMLMRMCRALDISFADLMRDLEKHMEAAGE